MKVSKKILFIVLFACTMLTVYFSIGWQSDDSFILREFAQNGIKYGFYSWDQTSAQHEYNVTPFWYGWLISVFIQLVGDYTVILEIVLNLTLLAYVIFTVGKTVQNKESWILALIASQYLLAWQFYGLETGIFSSLTTLFIFRLAIPIMEDKVISSNLNLALALALAVMRPDGLVYPIMYFILCALTGITRRTILKYLGVSFIIFGAHLYLLFHLTGDVLPSSYYFKLGGLTKWEALIKGVKYVLNFCIYTGLALPLLLVLITKRIHLKNIIVHFVYLFPLCGVIYMGGDWMVNYRFITPFILPMMYILFYSSQSNLNKINTVRVICSILVGLGPIGLIGHTTLSVLNMKSVTSNYNSYELLVANRNQRPWNPVRFQDPNYGELINLINSDTSIKGVGLSEAGYIPFRIDKPTVDLQGLTSTYLSKLISRGELTDSIYRSFLSDQNVTHILFWLDTSGKPRVAEKAYNIYFPDGVDYERVIYEKSITDDIYRYIKEPIGPYRVVLVEL